MTQKRILIVDDDANISKSLQLILSNTYAVLSAVGGQKAIELLAKEKGEFDLVLCDLNMPKINGADLYLYIKKTHPNLIGRIVFMTGGPYGSYIEEFAITNKNPCIKKPFNADELRAIIKTALTRT